MSGCARLVVASNRGPLSVQAAERDSDAEDDRIVRGGGGLVSGMQAALSAAPEAVWICAALNERERKLSRRVSSGRLSQIPEVADALAGEFDVRMLPIDALTFRQAYNGIANATLWFVLHMLYSPARTPVFDGTWRRAWGAYQRFNRTFAQAIAEEAAEGATVMIQDYHLFLAPKMVRELRPDVRIGHFTHTPWVPPEYFRMLPDDVAGELLSGLAAADVCGFHTPRWAEQFVACCAAIQGEQVEGRVHCYPLGVDADELTERAHRRDVNAAVRHLQEVTGGRQVIGRLDRTELSKNVYRGLLAYRELLRTRPEWRERVVHVINNYPSREDLPEYREYTASIERLAEDIDEEFRTDSWTPLVLDISNDYPGSLATLRLSDVLLVNSIRDGMNLVVFEGIVLSDRTPAVVLSRETGAAHVLGDDAVQINPFDVSHTVQALDTALRMPLEERRDRIGRLRAAAVALPPAAWFQAQLDEVAQLDGVTQLDEVPR